MATSHVYPNALQSCHEIEIYPDDRMTCASITATLLFDLKGAFDDNGTPDDFTDDKPRGTPLPCSRRESSSPDSSGLKTGAFVTDCCNGTVDRRGRAELAARRDVAGERRAVARGRRVARDGPAHGHRRARTRSSPAPRDSTIDVLAAHESELSQSGPLRHHLRRARRRRRAGRRLVLARASTTSAATAGCTSSRSRTSRRTRRSTTEQADKLHALTPEGEKADLPRGRSAPGRRRRSAPRTSSSRSRARTGSSWAGTRRARRSSTSPRTTDGTITLKEAGWFTPENANTWTSHVFKAQRNQDGTFTYWGATGDGILPGHGPQRDRRLEGHAAAGARSRGRAGARARREFPVSAGQGRRERARRAGPARAAARRRRRSSASACGRAGAGSAFSVLAPRDGAAVTVDLFRAVARAAGRRPARQALRATAARAFRWNGARRAGAARRHLPRALHDADVVGRPRRAPRRARAPRRHVEAAAGVLPPHAVRAGRDVQALAAGVRRPRRTPRSAISFRLNQQADVDDRRCGRAGASSRGVPRRSYVAGRTIRLRISAHADPAARRRAA